MHNRKMIAAKMVFVRLFGGAQIRGRAAAPQAPVVILVVLSPFSVLLAP